MKIQYVNNVSFKGIKVNGREQKQDKTSLPVRYAQSLILEDWRNNLDTLNSQYVDVEKEAAVLRKPAEDYEISETIPKDEFVREIQTFEQADNLLAKMGNLSNRMLALSLEAVEKIKKQDEQDRLNNLTEQEVVTIAQNKGVKNVAGYDYEMQVLNEEFISKVQREKQGEDVDIFGSILFFGPSGNGKTYITRAVAKSADCKVVNILPANTSNEARKKAMQKITAEAQKSEEKFNNDRTRTVIFIDEIDKLINDRSPVKEEFEEFIKTCSDKYHCSVFAATNYPMSLGIDMQDPDIFPVKMSIEPPEGDNAEAMLKYYFEQQKTENNIDYSNLVKELETREQETGKRFNNGQIYLISSEAKSQSGDALIKQSEIIEIIQTLPPQLTKKESEAFEHDKKILIGEGN